MLHMSKGTAPIFKWVGCLNSLQGPIFSPFPFSFCFVVVFLSDFIYFSWMNSSTSLVLQRLRVASKYPLFPYLFKKKNSNFQLGTCPSVEFLLYLGSLEPNLSHVTTFQPMRSKQRCDTSKAVFVIIPVELTHRGILVSGVQWSDPTILYMRQPKVFLSKGWSKPSFFPAMNK